VIVSFVMGVRKWRLPGRQEPVEAEPLDMTLLKWSPDDAFRVRDLVAGGVLILGRAGSGKTSGSGRALMRSIVGLRHSDGRPVMGGLINAAKPEEADEVRALFASVGRSDDLYVVNADAELRLDFIDYAMRMGGDTREITNTITTIGEALRGGDNKGRGEDGDMWEQQNERMIYCAVEIVKHGLGRVTASDLQSFIANCCYEPRQLHSKEWKAGFHYQTLQAAFNATKSEVEAQDVRIAAQYWLNEIVQMSPKTRSSIMVGVMQQLHCWGVGVVRSLTQKTNISPDEILAGKWVLINMPPSKYGNSGLLINAGWRYLTQKAVLRRQAKPGDPVVVIWGDEAQNWVTSNDAKFMAECRSHLGCQVMMTQSLHSLFATLSGSRGNEQALSLVSQFGTRIFHALGSAKDAEFASKLIGEERQQYMGGSFSPPESAFDVMMGTAKYSSSFSEHRAPVIEPAVFMNGMRCGGKNRLVDGIVVKNGEKFKDGRSYKLVTFRQEH
jgi:hypothetical protein